LQYVQGFADFHGERVRVTPEVLIPRPETELLLEAILPLIDSAQGEALGDVGTGSGILARNLARAHPALTIHAIDLSPTALEVAKGNLAGLSNVTFHQGHLLEPVAGISFQLLVANLPYIPRSVLPTLTREVRQEPSLALDGGEDGLDLIRELILSSRGRTRYLGLEIGHDQSEAVKSLLSQQGYEVSQIVKDFCQVERIIVGNYRG
jgi:release factor glutamine methyltransferase